MIAASRGTLMRQTIWNAPGSIEKEQERRRYPPSSHRQRRLGNVFTIGLGCSLASSAVTPTQQMRKRHAVLVAKAEELEKTAPASESQDAEAAPGDPVAQNQEESASMPGSDRSNAIDVALSGVDLTDSEAREQAFEYLSTRKSLKDELLATEVEFERLAVVMADPGAAMELNDRRVEMEEEIELMKEREQELAELMSQVQVVHNQVLERRQADGVVQRELGETKDKKTAALQELQSTDKAMAACKAELDEMHIEISSIEGKLQEVQTAADATRSQLPVASSRIEELKALAAEKQGAADAASEELSDFKRQIEELQTVTQQSEARAKSATEELHALGARKLSLEAALKDAQGQCESLKSDIAQAKDSAKDLPAELDTISKALEELQQEASQWKAKVAPKQAELEQRHAEHRALLDSVAKLEANHAELTSQIEVEAAAVDELSNEESTLKAKIEELGVAERSTSSRRDQLKECLPALKEVKDSLQQRVDELVQDSEQTRAALKRGARKLQKEFEAAETGSTVQEQRRLLDATASDVLEVASSISESQKKAQAAFQQALEERKIAETGFAELQVLMEKRITRMKALENMMMESLSEGEKAGERMDKFVEGVRASQNDLADVEVAAEQLAKQVDEKSDYDAVDTAVAAGVKLVSAFGDILSTASKPK